MKDFSKLKRTNKSRWPNSEDNMRPQDKDMAYFRERARLMGIYRKEIDNWVYGSGCWMLQFNGTFNRMNEIVRRVQFSRKLVTISLEYEMLSDVSYFTSEGTAILSPKWLPPHKSFRTGGGHHQIVKMKLFGRAILYGDWIGYGPDRGWNVFDYPRNQVGERLPVKMGLT